MSKYLVILMVFLAVFTVAAPAFAQEASADEQLRIEQAAQKLAASRGAFGINLTGAFGAGLVVIGAAAGIGRLAGSALESMARQPEVAGNIQTAMIIAAALIEGFTFYALYITSTGV